MQLARSGIALEAGSHRRARTSPGRPARIDPRRFGRAGARAVCAAAAPPALNSDLKLFATTFAAGFLFVSVLIA